MKTKYLLIIGATLCLTFYLYKFVKSLTKVSYPYAQRYQLNYSQSQVINAIAIVKKQNPSLNLAECWRDDENTDPWHHIYFNLDNHKILTWLKPNTENNTTFAFVRIEQANAQWKNINKDFAVLENKKTINVFENKILNKIKAALKYPLN